MKDKLAKRINLFGRNWMV